ncbi:pentatricopeptide repeat-containing protein At3g12770 isoform X2 [Andrographis paniculata]|uniref:pentatricopeptide repeat-containing protein At3g12770 isoform X2 n=1 Tax=Andrographis paniculata TaxID=175694 RepID=UPI0021E906F1|nr:pentatricopeptide repeat-containing protein At3g12770 isoform X2 [Andrographis paniculata]
MSSILSLRRCAFKFASPLNNSVSHCIFVVTFSARSSIKFKAESHYTALLDESTRRIHLAQIHNKLFKHGLQSNGFIITKFINKSSDIGEIRGYSMHNMPEKVLEMYLRMQNAFVRPDAYTFPLVVKACGILQAVGFGRAIHGQIWRIGFGDDPYVLNGLLSFYLSCEKHDCARDVFNHLSDRNIVSWTLIFSAYVQSGQPMKGLQIFRDMRESGVTPDWIALVSALKAYSDVEDLSQGKCIHGMVLKMGYEFELDLRIALTSLYAKCGQVVAAKVLFDQTETGCVILWNAMISGFAKNGCPKEALDLFTKMNLRNIEPNVVTVQSVVVACAHLGSLEQARWMEGYVNSSKFENDVVVRTSLIDMYAKCGSVESAREVFDSSIERDVVLWSSMIMCYALHGQGREAIALFNEMENSGVRPNKVTFLSLIMACSHTGLVDEGWEFFLAMKDYGLEPEHKHYASIVDLFGRAGYLDKAHEVITTMPMEPGVSVWGALLSACKIHRHVKLGEYAAEKLFTIDALDIGHYVQLSNLYASSRMWDGVERVRQRVKSKGLNKDSGYSVIEINGKLEAFRMGDKSHPHSNEIYEKLKWLEIKLIELGFTVDADSALYDVDEEGKGALLCNNS